MAAAIASSFLRLPHGLFWIGKGQTGKEEKDSYIVIWKIVILQLQCLDKMVDFNNSKAPSDIV